jgi:hypothetical protein
MVTIPTVKHRTLKIDNAAADIFTTISYCQMVQRTIKLEYKRLKLITLLCSSGAATEATNRSAKNIEWDRSDQIKSSVATGTRGGVAS